LSGNCQFRLLQRLTRQGTADPSQVSSKIVCESTTVCLGANDILVQVGFGQVVARIAWAPIGIEEAFDILVFKSFLESRTVVGLLCFADWETIVLRGYSDICGRMVVT
jgi:hypothetical protein